MKTRKKISRWAKIFGLDLGKTMKSLRGLVPFFKAYNAYKKAAGPDPDFPVLNFYPILSEARQSAGTAHGHYFHQDLLIAQRIFAHNPERHVDVGSQIEGFVAHVASFRKIEIVDIRHLVSKSVNISFVRADFMDRESAEKLGKADSVSCLHTVEHFGLGRYGDPLDPQGSHKGVENLKRIVSQGGRLYISVPIGQQRVEFNGQRVFFADTLPKMVGDGFRLDRFSYVDNAGDLHDDAGPGVYETDRTLGLDTGLGIYEFTRIS